MKYWVSVEYLVISGGSGSVRMWLHELPQWLTSQKQRDGLLHAAMVINIEIISTSQD